MIDSHAISWPYARLGEGIVALSRASGLRPSPARVTPPSEELAADEKGFNLWVETLASRLGLESEPVQTSFKDASAFLRAAGPAVLGLRPENGLPRFLLLLRRASRRSLAVICPDGKVRRLREDQALDLLCHERGDAMRRGVELLLDDVGIDGKRRQRARAALLDEHLGTLKLGGSWLLRIPPGGSIWLQMLRAGQMKRLTAVIAAHFVLYFLYILSWYAIGRGVLTGSLEPGWLLAWALLLITLTPVRMLESWSQEMFAVDAGVILKKRLLQGALKMRPEEISHQGAGQLLGRVLESETVESLALGAVFLGIGALIEIGIAVWVLSSGAGGWLQIAMLLSWTLLVLGLGWRYFRRNRTWTGSRLDVTHDLVERMIGHRTRLVQESPSTWHEDEDELLDRYIRQSRELDRTAILLHGLAPSGWLVFGLAGMLPAFVSGAPSAASLAISLGGVLLAQQALAKLTSSLSQSANLAVAWRQVAPLYHAAVRTEPVGAPGFEAARDAGSSSGSNSGGVSGPSALMEVSDVLFRHEDRTAPALVGCNLRIMPGERVLLEGPSGGGKSTLASLLTGLRQPRSGLVSLHGIDRPTWGGSAWRRRVSAAPQFHENHVFSGPLAFNLLLGRGWPPGPEDLSEAEDVCREVGLGDLLDRMPSGLLQTVGETGWELSHGERSRLFVARALLQGGDLTIFDESFGALDPESLQSTMQCVLKRASTLLVIAHP